MLWQESFALPPELLPAMSADAAIARRLLFAAGYGCALPG